MRMKSWPEVAMFVAFAAAGIVSAIYIDKEWAIGFMVAAAGVLFDVGAFQFPRRSKSVDVEVDVDKGVP